jgi:hypothetical protein
MIKSRRMRWARYVVCMEEMRNAQKFGWKACRNYGGSVWSGFIWLRIRTGGELL